MKKALSILGGAFLTLILIGAALIGIMIYQGSGLDRSSKAFVEENIRPIVSTWSRTELEKRASPQLLDVLNRNPGQTSQLFAKLSKLGALKSLDEPQGQATVAMNIGASNVISATYTETAEFENGHADLKLRLVQVRGQWRFLDFYVNSPMLLQ